MDPVEAFALCYLAVKHMEKKTVDFAGILEEKRLFAKIEEAMMSSHFIHKCVCGNVLGQCRCSGPKTETVSEICECKEPMENSEKALDTVD